MKKKRVLIIDDALDYRVLLSKGFKNDGYQVFLAKDGIEGYVKFFKVKPDIILLDILLPKMRGDTFIKWLKGTELGMAMPIIVVSGHTAMKDYLYELGVELFFEKPCPVKYVLLAAEGVVDIRQKIKNLNADLRQMKAKFDFKTFRSEEDVTEEKLNESRDYKICGNCHRTVPVSISRCPRCGSSNIEAKFLE